MTSFIRVPAPLVALTLAALPLEAVAQACLVSEMQSYPSVYAEDFGTGSGRSADPNVLSHTFQASGGIQDDFYAVGRSLDLSGTYMRTAGNVDADGDTNGRYLGINMRGRRESPPSWVGEFYRQNNISLTPPTLPAGASIGGFRFSTSLSGTCIGCSHVPDVTLILEDANGGAQLGTTTSAAIGVVNDGNWYTANLDVSPTPSSVTAVNLVLFNSQPTGSSGNDVGIDNIDLAPLVCLAPSVDFTKSAEIITTTVGDPLAAEVGDVIRYTYTVENNGSATAYNVSISEGAGFTGAGSPPLPSVQSGAADLDGGNGTATDLAPGRTLVFTADYVIQQADIDAGGVVNNQADLAMEDLEGTEFTDVSDEDTSSPGDQITVAVIPVAATDDITSESVPGTTVAIGILDNDGSSSPQGAPQPATVSLIPPSGSTGAVTDAQGDIIGFDVPNQGTWSYDDTTGELEFDPLSSFVGNPTPVSYTVEGTNGATSNEATVTLIYGDAPVAQNDVITDPVTGPVSIDPLANDTGSTLVPSTVMLTGTGAPVGSTLSSDRKTLTVPNQGVWSVDPASGVVTFSPELGFSGVLSPAAYTVNDSNGLTSNEATISAAAGAPAQIQANADAFSIDDAAAGGSSTSVLSNDRRFGAPITLPSDVILTPGTAPSPAAGSLVMNPDGTISVAAGTTPGTYSYPYQICDSFSPTVCSTAVATVVVGAAALLDEIEDELVEVLEEDKAATLSQISRQISGYAADAGQRLRNRHASENACLEGVNAVLERENILFDTDRAVIKPQSARVLDEITDVLEGCSGVAFEIAGHTDSDASESYNLDLSQRRVEAVLRALAERGIDTAGYLARGYGETQPVASNASRAGKAQNRRVEFRPLDGERIEARCDDDQRVRSLDASVTGDRASVDGRFLRERHDCYRDVREIYEGTLSHLETDGSVSQTMLNLSYRRERFTDEDSIRGYFAGLYLSENDISSDATGEIQGLGVNGGIYGADRLRNGLFVDYYLGAAAGVHDFDLTFGATSGPVTATGDYTYYAAFAGAAVSGELEIGEKTISPRIGLDYVYSPESDVDVTALNGAPTSGSLELASLSGGRVFAEIGTTWDVNHGDTRLGVTPRVACYQSIEGLDGACGFGGSASLTSIGEDTGYVYSLEVDGEFGDGYNRGALSASISRTLPIGTLSGTAKHASGGAASIGGAYELKF